MLNFIVIFFGDKKEERPVEALFILMPLAGEGGKMLVEKRARNVNKDSVSFKGNAVRTMSRVVGVLDVVFDLLQGGRLNNPNLGEINVEVV